MATRILFSNATHELGGADQSLFELVRCLDRDRFEPHVVLPGPGPFAAGYAALGVPVHELPLWRLKNTLDPRWHLRWLWAAPRRLRAFGRLLERLRPAVVHLNSSVLSLDGLAARRYADRRGARVVWHVRELDLKPALVERAVFAQVARRADAVVAISRAVAARLPAGAPVEVIGNGCDLRRFAPDPRRTAGSEHVGWIGRAVPWKGLHLALDAFARVAAVRPAARLLVCAVPVAEHGAYLRQCKARLPELAGRIDWLPPTDHPEQFYDRCDLLLHLPERAEPLGRTAIEAQAAGVPVVCWPRGGLVDLVAPGAGGALARDGDLDDAAAQVVQWLADPAARAALGAAGAARAQAEFASERCAERIAALYDRLLAAPAAAARR